MREVKFTPSALAAYETAADQQPHLGDRLDEALDWIETQPVDVRAKRRAWSGGMYGIDIRHADQDWLIIWNDSGPQPLIVYIGTPTNL